MTRPLVLASGSPYRKTLLARLGLPFEVVVAGIDESSRPGEAPRQLVRRLALEKAAAVATLRPEAWVVGSDQLAVCDDRILGKPGSKERCVEQLLACSGRCVEFLTAVAVIRPGAETAGLHVDSTEVRFRTLGQGEVERYVEVERPFDCAGGFKCEGLGIALFEAIRSEDPTALIGLPLIWLATTLRSEGLDPLAAP